MGIGYSPIIGEVLEYYGVEKESPILDELYEGVRDRALVVTDDKKALAHRREHPTFPRSKEDLAQAVRLVAGHRRDPKGYPGLHCTHAAYIDPPKKYGEFGTWKAFHFFVDIDSSRGLEESRRVAMAMCKELAVYDVPYMLKFSGLAGFHIHIDYSSFPKKIDGEDLIRISPKLYQRLKLHLISKSKHACRWFHAPVHPSQYRKDTSGLQRIEYSLHEHSGLVAVPMRNEELSTFQMKDAMIGRVEVLDGWRRTGQTSSMDALLAELGSTRSWAFRLFFERG